MSALQLFSSVQYTATSAVLLLLKHLELHLSLGCILGFTAPVLSPGRHFRALCLLNGRADAGASGAWPGAYKPDQCV